MAGPVKGTWGGEDIELNDAATETTLLLLLDAVRKGGGSGGGGSGTGDLEKDLKDLSDKSKESGDQIEELGETAEETSSMLANGFNNIFGAAKGLATELLVGGDRLSDFTSHITGAISEIPLIGGVLGGASQAFVSVIDSTIDNFRELSQSGIGFGESLFDIQGAAAKSGLSLETFQQTLSNNSETLALFGGSASAGAKRFQEVSGVIQKQFGPQFSALGLTMEETAQFTADYMEMQTRLGRNSKMSASQQAQGTANYIKQLDYLAKVTGKQRSEVAAMLKEQATDKRLKLIMGSMSDAAQANLQGTLAMMDGASPELKDAITEMVATGGVPMSDMAKDMARLNPRLASMAKGLRDGTVSQEAYAAEVRRTAEGVNNMSDAQRQQYAVLQAQGSAIGSSVVLFQDLTKFGAGAADALDDQKKRMEAGNAGLLDFERRITEVRNLILGALIESGVFQSLEDAFADVVDMFTGDEGVSKIKPAIEKITNAITEFIADVQDFGIQKVLGDLFSQAMSGLGNLLKEGIKSLFGFGGGGGGGGDQEAEKKQFDDAIASREAQLATIKENIAKVKADDALSEDQRTAQLEALNANEQRIQDRIAQLQTEKAELSSSTPEAPDDGGGLFGIDMGTLGTVAGVIGSGGAVYVAFKVFQKLLSGFAAPQVAVGAAVFTGMLVGTGAAIMLAGKGIDFAGQGVERIKDAVQGLSEIKDVANLKEVAGVLGPLAVGIYELADAGFLANFAGDIGKLAEGVKQFESVDPMALFNVGPAISNVAGPIGELGKAGFFANFVSSGALPGLADGVRAFENLDVNQLWLMGPALQSLYDGISSFTGDGVFDSVSKGLGGMISSFFEGEGQFDQLVEDLKAFDQVDADAIYKVGSGLAGFKDFMGGELNLDNVPKLKEAMAGIAEFSGDDVNLGNIQFTSDGLRNLQDVTNGLDSDSIFSYNSALKELIKTLEKMNEALGDQAGTEAGAAAQGAVQEALAGGIGTGTGGADKLDQLNSTMNSILNEMISGNKIGGKTYKATKANSDSMW